MRERVSVVNLEVMKFSVILLTPHILLIYLIFLFYTTMRFSN